MIRRTLFAIALAAACALAYIERVPEPAEEKIAPTRWGCSSGQHRCYWDKQQDYAVSPKAQEVQIALYKWGCRPVCYKPDHV